MATETITRRIGATERGWRPERLFGRDWRVAWLFIFPTVMLMGGLIAYPFLSAVWLSFNRVTGIRNFGFVGLDNYIDVWQDPFFLDSVRVTMIFTFTSVAVKLVIG